MLARQLITASTSRVKFQQFAMRLQAGLEGNAREVRPSHWMFEVRTKKKRSQVVHLILKEHETEDENQSRLVIDSPIGPLPQRFSLEWLMRENAGLDVGAICIEDFRNEENELVTYLTHRASHRVSTVDFDDIWEAVHRIAHVADGLEENIYAHDVC